LTGYTHLKFSGQLAVLQVIDKAELRSGCGRFRQEDHGRRSGSRDLVVDDVALVVKVDGFERLARSIGKNI
jgi:hypothetical protein